MLAETLDDYFVDAFSNLGVNMLHDNSAGTWNKSATLSNDMPTKIIQQFSEIFTEFLSSNCNSSLESKMFPSEQE